MAPATKRQYVYSFKPPWLAVEFLSMVMQAVSALLGHGFRMIRGWRFPGEAGMPLVDVLRDFVRVPGEAGT